MFLFQCGFSSLASSPLLKLPLGFSLNSFNDIYKNPVFLTSCLEILNEVHPQTNEIHYKLLRLSEHSINNYSTKFSKIRSLIPLVTSPSITLGRDFSRNCPQNIIFRIILGINASITLEHSMALPAEILSGNSQKEILSTSQKVSQITLQSIRTIILGFKNKYHK